MNKKTKLTDEFIKDACDALRLGNFVCTVVDYLGTYEKSWYMWIRHAKEVEKKLEEDENYKPTETELRELKFYKETEKAKAESVVRNLELINKAAVTTWQAASWLLERRYPELYGLKNQIVIKDDDSALSIDEVRTKLEELKKKKNYQGT